MSKFMLLSAFFLALHFRINGWKFVFRQLQGRRRWTEVALLSLNLALSVAPAAVLGLRWIAVYVAGQMLGSLYFGLISAPNHKGMPVWPAGSRPSYLERHTLSSRNVGPGPLLDVVYGGLNHQIEHHLFPTIPRSKLGRARAIVKPFCAAHGLPFTEVSMLASYRAIARSFRGRDSEIAEQVARAAR
jgi:fatty acid desaturase